MVFCMSIVLLLFDVNGLGWGGINDRGCWVSYVLGARDMVVEVFSFVNDALKFVVNVLMWELMSREFVGYSDICCGGILIVGVWICANWGNFFVDVCI